MTTDKILELFIQLPFLAIFIWIVIQRDKQWQSTLSVLTLQWQNTIKEISAQWVVAIKELNNQTVETIKIISSNTERLNQTISSLIITDEIVKKLSDEFWGRQDTK